jgi:hypothetical protein
MLTSLWYARAFHSVDNAFREQHKMAKTPNRDSTIKRPSKYVQPIHFEDFSGKQFERLVFAYHARAERWLSLEWFGQQGKDEGRDIFGTRLVDGRKDGESMCVLCANWRKLTLAKVKADLDEMLKSPAGKPNRVRVVGGHDVPASLRDDAKKYALRIAEEITSLSLALRLLGKCRC